MKKQISRIVTLVLVLAMAVSLGATALAEGGPGEDRLAEGLAASMELNKLGLLNGVGTNPDGTPDFDLASTINRETAITLLVRLMGGEREAFLADYVHPFGDVKSTDWSDDYVGYAYYHKITNGTDDTKDFGQWTFSPRGEIPLNQFLTLVLRAMGYADVDYTNPYPLADSLGLRYPSGEGFYRCDLAVTALSALDCAMSGGGTLREMLTKSGAIGGGQTKPDTRFTPGPVVPAITEVTVNTPEELGVAMTKAANTHVKTVTIKSDTVSNIWNGLISPFFAGTGYEVYNSYGGACGFGASGDGRDFYGEPKYRDAVQVESAMEGRGYEWDEVLVLLANTAKEVVAENVDPSMSDYEILLTLHDYLVNNCTYWNSGRDRDYSAAACLIDGHCVCEGYFNAYELLCYLVGIDCFSVAGNGHGWNRVKLEGKWYNVDVTWDDPVGAGDMLLHTYFLVSDDFMRSTGHVWTSHPDWPDAVENWA